MSILILLMAAPLGVEPANNGAFVAPDWVRRPTAMEVAQFYPLRSALLGEEGHATITCTVELSGLLKNCQIDSETPEGRGFGDAALKVTKVMRMRPGAVDGKPVGGLWVTIPLIFKTNAASANLPGLTESLACYGRFSARLRVDPANAKADLGAQWSRYWADKAMKLSRISKPYREKRLVAAAAKFTAPPAWSNADARCEAAFLPDAPV